VNNGEPKNEQTIPLEKIHPIAVIMQPMKQNNHEQQFRNLMSVQLAGASSKCIAWCIMVKIGGRKK